MRCRSGRGVGRSTSGTLAELRVDPSVRYRASLPAASRAIAACASSVDPPICGVRITLESPARGVENGSSLRLRFAWIDIDRGTAEAAIAEGFGHGLEVHNRATSIVDEHRTGPHPFEFGGADQVRWSTVRRVHGGVTTSLSVESRSVSDAESIGTGIADRELRSDVVVDRRAYRMPRPAPLTCEPMCP